MTQQIIVIDDSDTVREQVAIVLVGAGYEVIEAADGMAGAAAIRGNPTAALAICDVNMPRLNGVDMLEMLDGTSAGSMPVLMLTTEGRPDLIERARAFGAKGWMVKPFKPTMLLATVRKLVRSTGT
ncbi:MAG TPA: response regulator [Labilithrix sp.]|nr:response regulator [Labilithrix sp.]